MIVAASLAAVPVAAPSTGWDALYALPPSVVWPMVGIPAGFLLAFGIFCLQCLVRGMPRTPRMEKLARSKLVPRLVLEYGYWLLYLPVRLLLALGLSADQVTLISLGFACASAWYVAHGHFAIGGWLVYLSFIFDALDGMVARARGTSSDRGEYFDAFIDRYADFALFAGYAWYYRDEPLALGLTVAALVGSSVMGYARAKGEAVGIDPNVGWAARHERAAFLGTLTVFAPVAALWLEPGAAHPLYHLVVFALGVVALFSNLAAIQRAHYVMSRMRKPPPPKPEPEPEPEPERTREQTA
jgi:CDP-diacylglycerol--glycerol-3-phosphate 3-phosphatidyltransferase